MYQLNPAPLDSDNSDSKGIFKKSKSNMANKTMKNKNLSSLNSSTNGNATSENYANQGDNDGKIKDINSLISQIHENNGDDDDNNNFTKLLSEQEQPVQSKQAMQTMQNLNPSNVEPSNLNSELQKIELQRMMNGQGEHNSLGNLTMNSNFANYNDSYKTGYNFTEGANNSIADNNKLLTKLDYIVHLLEEQHNEKTNYITEELILYLFLGIFIIFVLDSFARASKYVR